MQNIKAADLKVGDHYKHENTIQEVIEIVKVSAKAIEIRTRRIFPDNYAPKGGFFARKNLGTVLTRTN